MRNRGLGKGLNSLLHQKEMPTIPSCRSRGGVQIFLKSSETGQEAASTLNETRRRLQGAQIGRLLWAMDIVLVGLAFAQLSYPRTSIGLPLAIGGALIGVAAALGLTGLWLQRSQ